jgi:hypothetical protein
VTIRSREVATVDLRGRPSAIHVNGSSHEPSQYGGIPVQESREALFLLGAPLLTALPVCWVWLRTASMCGIVSLSIIPPSLACSNDDR